MVYQPGSFTKNFAWHGKGFRKLHSAIRVGFKNQLLAVSREDWRKNSGLNAGEFYIAANFFLCNVIIAGKNVIPIDELVVQAVTRDHSAVFDRLALFAFNLSVGGNRIGANNGMSFPSLWAKEFVCQQLWQFNKWDAGALDANKMDVFLRTRIAGPGRIKCRMNYRHFYELAQYLPTPHRWINSDAVTWAAPALFLAWDRRVLTTGGAITPRSLLATSKTEEDHKLLGMAWADFENLAVPIAAEYIAASGIGRLTAHTAATTSAPSPLPASKPIKSVDPEDLMWLTDAASQAAVEREHRRRLTQKRDQVLAAKLKDLYEHTCMACKAQLIVELSPLRHYAEAAHIRPLGNPHKGPDVAANMIVLCPNHHLQFDRGVLSLRMAGSTPVFSSRIPKDPIHDKLVPLRAKHTLDPSHISWHQAWAMSVAKN